MAQAAESFVCQLVGETSLTALETAVPVENGGEQQVRVSHRDGRSWTVAAQREPATAPTPESCAKPAVPVHGWRLRMI